jgi:hypothetical protein
MSVALFGPALEVLREFRWWFAPSPGSCSLPALALAAIVISGCCFCAGLVAGICVASARCRTWLWHCFLGAANLWQDPSLARGTIELRERFREYHRA